MADIRVPLEPAGPVEPVGPTSCPTCFSGLQPVDPPYEDTLDPGF